MSSVTFYFQVVFLMVCLAPVADCKKGTNITSLHACTDIKYRFATTRITSHVTNPSNESQQAVFDITLPNDAFISNFTLEIGGKTYLGRVEERDQALRDYGVYTTIPEGARSGGRVTQRPRETNQFQVALNVGPLESVTFNLTYQEILQRRLGTYDHVLYIDPGQPVEDMRVDVSLEERRDISYLHVPPIRSDSLVQSDANDSNGLVDVERPSRRQAYISYHPSPRHQQLHGMSRDGLSGLFTVQYDVNRTMDAGEVMSVNGYFVHFIAPPVQDPIPKDVLFILDTSTSMRIEKLGQMQDAMRVILSDLAPTDRFAFMQFNSKATFWKKKLLPVNPTTMKWAMQYVNTLKARGYTNIDSSMEKGLDFFNEDPTVKGDNALIIFLTDGRPTRGETDRRAILKKVRAQNRKNVAVYGLAFGKDAAWPLVKVMASQNHGLGRRIYQDADAALQIQGFYAELSTLLLTGVRATYLDSEVDVQTLTATQFPQFFNGSELVVAGKLAHRNQSALQVQVQASGAQGQVNLTVSPEPDPAALAAMATCGVLDVKDLPKVAEKMWAYLTIRQMLHSRVAEGDERRKQELKDKALKLALKYKFVTPVTSLVVSKPGSEELAFLQEDASDLLDEADLIKAENLTALQSTPASTVSRGGGGGDPHFMVELTSLAYPLCYDIRGDTGDVFRLLRDPHTGLTVNLEIGAGHTKTNVSRSRYYITRAAILLQDVILEITTEYTKVDDVILDWDTTDSVYLPGVWVMMTNASLRFALDLGVEIDVTRHVRNRTNQRGENFLNVEVQNEALLSPDSSGLLGQFVHKDVTLQKIKRRHGRLVAELEIRWKDGQHKAVRHGRAVIKNRKDPFFKRKAPCLMVGSLWSSTLDRPTRFYKVRNIYDVS